jgi:prevent-host-death family protein
MTDYTVAEAKNQLTKLIDRALAGEEVVITRRGKAVVSMVSKCPAPGIAIDLEWLKSVQVTPRDPNFDVMEVIRAMKDEDPY